MSRESAHFPAHWNRAVSSWTRWTSVLIAVLLGTALLAAQVSGRPNRISQSPQVRPPVELPGTAHPLVAQATDLGAVNSSLQFNSLTINIAPDPRQRQEIASLQKALQDPKSPQYHKWLTQAQYGSLFGLSDPDLAQLKTWLTSQGFTVGRIAPSRNAITFSGKAWQVESAFHTQLHRYQLDGETHFANATALHIPAQFAGVITNVRGLDNFRPKPSVRRIAVAPQYTYNRSFHYLSPGDWNVIYDLAGTTAAGFDGTGTHIAVVGQTYAPQSDIDNFRAAAGLPATNLVYACISSADCADAAGIHPGDLGEADLDIEWAGGVAPNATVDYIYASGADTSLGVFDALAYAIQFYALQDGTAVPIVSMSYGACEQQFPTSIFSVVDALGQQASLQGQTLLVSSGDSGAAGCDAHGDPAVTTAAYGLSVNVPADSPNFTAVGGTAFSGDAGNPTPYWANVTGLVTSALQYIPESAWNETGSSGLAASGGGESATLPGASGPVFPQPSWQSGLIANSGGGRLVPDISFAAAAGHDGYLGCSSDFDSAAYGTTCANGFFSSGGTGGSVLYSLGGTSASTPSFAGMLALFVQRYGPLGNINPVLYGLAADPASYATVFHDVTTGDSNMPCLANTAGCVAGVIGFAAGTGYDQVTGLGSVDGGALFGALASTYTHAGTTTLVNLAPNPVVIGNSVLVSATVTSLVAGNITGTVDFYTATVDLGTAPVIAGVASLGGVPTGAANGLVLGTQTIYAAYSGDVNYVSSSGAGALLVSTPFASMVTVAGGPVAVNGTTTLTAAVTSLSPGLPTGTVTFATASATLGTAPLVAGVATLANVSATVANGLAKGSDFVTATYSGDSTFLPSMGSAAVVVYDPSVPLLLSLSSETGNLGGTDFTLSVFGANFAPTSLVLWNGSVRATTYISSTQLTVVISSLDLAVEGVEKVSVANLTPSASSSAALPFTVMAANPVARITGDSLSDAPDGNGNHLLTLSGADFLSSSIIDWGGTSLSTSYVGPGILSATITAADFSTRPATVTVNNPAGTSPGFVLP